MNEFNTCDIIDAPTHPVKKKKTLKNFLVKFNKGDMQRPKSDFFFVLEGLEY